MRTERVVMAGGLVISMALAASYPGSDRATHTPSTGSYTPVQAEEARGFHHNEWDLRVNSVGSDRYLSEPFGYSAKTFDIAVDSWGILDYRFGRYLSENRDLSFSSSSKVTV